MLLLLGFTVRPPVVVDVVLAVRQPALTRVVGYPVTSLHWPSVG